MNSTAGTSSNEPLSREDALAQRLKSLRAQRDETPNSDSKDPPPPYAEAEGGTQPPIGPYPPSSAVKTAPGPAARVDEADGNDPSQPDDDQTLEEILDGLVLDDDHWSVSDDEGDDGNPSAKQVEQLLVDLGKKPQSSTRPDDVDGDASKDEAADDSEGEEMSRRVRDVLDRTMDELKLEGHSDPTEPDRALESPGSDQPETGPTDRTFSLPTVPQTPTEDSPPPDLPTTPNTTTELTLPTVPTNLQDPVPSTNAPADPFESSIAARLAALKGPGHKPISTDAFGLPSAPTFHPEDRPVTGVAKKPGYSDEDMKTWCIVCLEDATVRCAGCDGDVYCARCWKDMHVGPAAGYDERGHRWEKFDPRKI